MINAHSKTISITMILMAVISLSACSTVSKISGLIGEAGGVDYQNNKSVKNLEIPPDLTRPEFDRAFALPAGTFSAVALKNGEYRNLPNSGFAAYSGEASSIIEVAGKTALRVNSTYANSLKSTEKHLSEMGFTIVSKSPAGDVITAKYTGEDILVSDRKIPSFLKNIYLGSDRRKVKFNTALTQGNTYRVSIKNDKGTPTVRFAQNDGKSIPDDAHSKIIRLLNTAFNS